MTPQESLADLPEEEKRTDGTTTPRLKGGWARK